MNSDILKMFQNNQENIKRVFNNLTEGIIVADVNGKFLFFNDMADSILGLGLQQVNPAEWSEIYGCYSTDTVTPVPSEDLPLTKTIKNGQKYHQILYIKNHVKSEGVFIDISSSPIFAESQNVVGGMVIFRDITARHRAETELSRLSNAVNQTADAVMISNIHGIIEYINPAFEWITGFKSDEVLGKTPRILKSGDYSSAFYQNLWKTILTGLPYKEEMINKKKNGDLIWIQNTITPIKDDKNQITHFVAVMKDITDLKARKEQELRLQIAQEIQQRLLHFDVEIPGFSIAGKNFPADETGGDYFDVIRTDHDGLWLTVADVSSHGIGSALLMAGTRAYLRAFIDKTTDPGFVLEKLNNALYHDLNEVQFVTMLLVYINVKSRYVTYSGAGHVPGFLLDNSGGVKHLLESPGIPLGYQKNVRYKNIYLSNVDPGDVFVFSTDGIIEAQNNDEIAFGSDRILSIVRKSQRESASVIIDHIYQEVCQFTQKDQHDDDVTLTICKVGESVEEPVCC